MESRGRGSYRTPTHHLPPLARHRIESGESYVAEGVALNEAFKMPRISRDIDLFLKCATGSTPLGVTSGCSPSGISPGPRAARIPAFHRQRSSSLPAVRTAPTRKWVSWHSRGRRPARGTCPGKWHAMIEGARLVVAALPPAEAGKAVFLTSGELCRDGPTDLMDRLRSQGLVFHQGRVRGALPVLQIRGPHGRGTDPLNDRPHLDRFVVGQAKGCTRVAQHAPRAPSRGAQLP